MRMRNISRFLCVVMALIIAFSAASCTLTKQYSYKTDDVELPIGAYIYYLRSAYAEAETYAQKSDKYDAEKGTYDGNTSFLQMEITDDDGKTAVAEQWIIDKTEQRMNEAVALYYEMKKLGASYDEDEIKSTKKEIEKQWADADAAKELEGYGISCDSFCLVNYTLSAIRSAVFSAEYGEDGPSAVSEKEMQKYVNDNYTSYKYFSANLYTTIEADDSEGTSENVAMSDEEVKKYEKAFKAYAKDINSGKAFSEVLNDYNTAFEASATATENVQKIDKDTTDELNKQILSLKEGQAKYKIIGDDAKTRQIYVIYRVPIASEKSYLSEHKDEVLSEMKSDDFTKLLESIAKELKIDRSSACDSYKPSMFE